PQRNIAAAANDRMRFLSVGRVRRRVVEKKAQPKTDRSPYGCASQGEAPIAIGVRLRRKRRKTNGAKSEPTCPLFYSVYQLSPRHGNGKRVTFSHARTLRPEFYSGGPSGSREHRSAKPGKKLRCETVS